MTWKESCCGSSVTCKGVVVEEAVVWCVLCVSLSVCCSVAVRCAVAVCCSVCCGSGVVVGTRGGAGDGCCSSLLSRVVLGEVAAVAAAAQTVADLVVEEVVAPATAVVAVVAGTWLEEVDMVKTNGAHICRPLWLRTMLFTTTACKQTLRREKRFFDVLVGLAA